MYSSSRWVRGTSPPESGDSRPLSRLAAVTENDPPGPSVRVSSSKSNRQTYSRACDIVTKLQEALQHVARQLRHVRLRLRYVMRQICHRQSWRAVMVACVESGS